jgi:transposase
VTRSGSLTRRFRGAPTGHKPVILEMKVQRLAGKACLAIRQENIHFVTGKRAYTNQLSRLVIELSRIGTIKDVAHHLHLSWDTVKEIQKRYLLRK